MKSKHAVRLAGLLSAAMLLASCSNDATTVRPFAVGDKAPFDVQPGPPVLDQRNGTLGFQGTDIRKGFNPHNPQTGDAIIATFIWQGTATNVITSVHDQLTDGTPVGNSYSLIEYRNQGGISMATYVALNVQNFPQGNPSDPNPDQNKVLVVVGTLSQPITAGGIMISSYKGVATASAVSAHASASGAADAPSQASTGPITPGAGALIYSVSTASPGISHEPPAGFAEITNMSTGDGLTKIVGQWAVHSGSGTSDPTWTWFFNQPGNWILTNVALLPNGGGGPTTGDLTATTSTTGSNQDPDGYTVSVDGGAGQAIGINGSVTFNGLSAANHSVALTGVASNCTVSGSNPRTVSVPAGGTATTAFSVSCAVIPPSTGDLSVAASTTGSDLDADGYTATVDGSSSQAVATNGSVTFTGLSEGNHSVALSGVAGNCTVGGSNPRSVSVPGGGTASTTFSVSCTAIPPTTGDLQVNTSTTGSSMDPNGYAVVVDGGAPQAIAINGTVTFSGLSQGSHSVALTDVASNCTVLGSNPRTISVPAGGTASTSFQVSCVSPNTAPVVNAGPDQTVLVGLLFSETWSFTDPDNGPWSYIIDWGDGTFSSGTKTSAGSFTNAHTYGTLLLGKHTIRITVTDSQGASHTDTKLVTVVLL
jgi:hypothetical protein